MPRPLPATEPVNATEMAALLGVTRPTVIAWHEAGKIPAEIAEGRTYRFDAEKVKQALRTRATAQAK